MTEEYIKRNPGDLVASEDWNELQVKIKEDIASQVGQVEAALNEFKEAPVDAEKFGGKDTGQWEEHLDQRYAPLDHEHDGVRRYQRYFLELETVIDDKLQPAVIEHEMGRQPVVQVYELETLPIVTNGTVANDAIQSTYKLCFCGPPHADRDAIKFKTKSWDERHWGDPIEDVIRGLVSDLDPKQRQKLRDEFKVDFTLNAWLSNLEEALFEPGPAQYHFDVGDVYRTQWVKDREKTKVNVLKEEGEWPPRLIYRPLLVHSVLSSQNGSGTPNQVPIDIYHLNLDEVEIAPQTANVNELHLMVILRS